MFAKSKRLLPGWMQPKTAQRARKSTSAPKDTFGRLQQDVRLAQKKFTAPWKRMTQAKAEKDEPRSVNEFLSQERP
jgi:hypothetical protein